MSEFDKLADTLDPFLTLKAIGDLREEQGKSEEAYMWRVLAAKRRFPSPTKTGKFRWYTGVGRNSADRLPSVLAGKVKPRNTVRKLFEDAVEAMTGTSGKDRESMLWQFSTMRGEK